MSRRRKTRTTPEEEYQNLVFRFLVTPFIILVGIFFIGAVIENLFEIPKAAAYIFAGLGGISFVVVYFRKEIQRVMNKD